jgi:hypothetical protein
VGTEPSARAWHGGLARSIVAAGICAGLSVAPALAQVVEVAPTVGYRFGGDPFEAVTGMAQDVDGSVSAGIVCDVPLGGGLSVEAFYTRQSASLAAASPAANALPARIKATIEYWHAGGIQEFSAGAARPFLTGTIGLTRLAAAEDTEVRFSLAAGGGVKLRASDHLSVRLDSRVFVTFMDGSVTTLACTTGRCLTRLHLTTVWQADFTAGLGVAF